MRLIGLLARKTCFRKKPLNLKINRRSFCRFAICLLFFMAGMALSLNAATTNSVTLAWNRSPATNIAGYKVYYGLASRTYTSVVNAGNVTNTTISGLSSGSTYFFAATSYDTSGLESDYSAEISYTIAVAGGTPPVITLTSPTDGAIFTAPGSIGMGASVTTNGHTINKVQFYNGTSLLAEDTASPYSYTWTNVAAGAYVLTARLVYDSSNILNSTAANVTVAAARPPPSSVLTFAADSGTITAPFVAANGAISQTVETGVTTGGRAVYNATISVPGDYMISTLVNAPNESANSFYVNIDGEPTDPTMIWDIPVTSGFTNRLVSWRGNGTPSSSQYVPIVFTLSAGTHQIIVRGREANTQLKTLTLSIAPKLKMKVSPNKLVAGGQQYVLTGTGQPNTTYQIQASTNLSTWSVIGTATTDSNGIFQFTDPTSGYHRSCSYRMQGAMP